jgi:riboflavin biosynthesis pyrimidine reductase
VQVLKARGTGPWGEDLSDDELRILYAVPRRPWLRANMVTTLDGAAAGPDGRTGSINNASDKRVFDLLRAEADAIVVGAGTARTERYRPTDQPTVVVSARGHLPELLAGGSAGSVLMVTRSKAEGLAETRATLGDEHVIVVGDEEVDLGRMCAALHERGLTHLLCEGGPTLLRDLVAAGQVDELCATVVPTLVAAFGTRMTSGPPLDVPLELRLLLEEHGTILGRWYTRRA